MLNRKCKLMVALLIAVLFCMATMTAFAHAIVVEPQEGTVVTFSYSDGTSAKGAKIIVRDADGNDIGKGKVDKNGCFDYAEYADQAASLYMNDGEGHAATYDIPAAGDTAEAPVAEETVADATEEPVAEETETPAATEEPVAEATEAPAAEPEVEETKSSTGTIVVVVIIVAAAIVIVALLAKRKKA